MFVVDTNILVRFAVNDDVAQVAQARRAIGSQTIWVGVTVLLELEWVLRSRYDYSRAQIRGFLGALLETAGVTIEDEQHVGIAIDWYGEGADFADALHLVRGRQHGTLLTFDVAFCATAQRRGEGVKVLRPTAPRN
jgi:predicted nucleic-acid-binding protein